jgi:tRNA threonylcarbamoyladenosine biosynthesis protein TsaB
MIIALDTSTSTCRLAWREGNDWSERDWEAARELAKGLLSFLEETIGSLESISGIIAYQGPGSFTGLRIGLTVLNTIADAQEVPIVGVTGDDWRDAGLRRLEDGDSDQIVMPLYGSEPNITTPRNTLAPMTRAGLK